MSLCLYAKVFKICELSRKTFLATNSSRNIVSSSPLLFKMTPIVNAEPMKKKKRVDPAILKSREDRKKRKIEKEIKKLSRQVLQPKPLVEMEVPIELQNSPHNRVRAPVKLSDEEEEERVEIFEKWTQFKKAQKEEDIKMINKVLLSKQNALQALRDESEDLYQEAIQLDSFLLPFTAKGPNLFPPIKAFDPFDGEINDITREWKL